jgi:hypothetical protein
MRLFITILLSLTCLNLRSADSSPFDNPLAGPKPITVLIQTDPWAMVIGADTPRVAVYEDGEVIFLKESGAKPKYHHKKLSETELSDFKKRLAPAVGLKDLKRSYNLSPNVTDQPSSLFYIQDGGHESVTSVYGLRATGKKLPAYTTRAGTSETDTLPEELIELHKFLSSIDYSDSKEWIPPYLEVMIWPYEYAPETSIIWPKDWPGLDSKRAVKHGNSYSIYVDGSTLPELQKFLKTRKEKGAVEIGGKKWAVSYRYEFPGEAVWMKAFRGSQKGNNKD